MKQPTRRYIKCPECEKWNLELVRGDVKFDYKGYVATFKNVIMMKCPICEYEAAIYPDTDSIDDCLIDFRNVVNSWGENSFNGYWDYGPDFCEFTSVDGKSYDDILIERTSEKLEYDEDTDTCKYCRKDFMSHSDQCINSGCSCYDQLVCIMCHECDGNLEEE